MLIMIKIWIIQSQDFDYLLAAKNDQYPHQATNG